MEFQGQMEGRSLSWAFRAADGNNYYATKLVIAKPGADHNAGLVRYAVVDGRESAAVRLPLPLSLERGVDYRVRMTVQDDHFITYLNGQVISSWTDTRAQARRSGLLRGSERSPKGRLGQRVGTRQLHGPHAGPLLAVRSPRPR